MFARFETLRRSLAGQDEGSVKSASLETKFFRGREQIAALFSSQTSLIAKWNELIEKNIKLWNTINNIDRVIISEMSSWQKFSE